THNHRDFHEVVDFPGAAKIKFSSAIKAVRVSESETSLDPPGLTTSPEIHSRSPAAVSGNEFVKTISSL
uniref:Uncharacterized protein n=1 Tax=Leersia perrieri TaxID=77586 RepID=A0A0D9UXC1_9ORYZ